MRDGTIDQGDTSTFPTLATSALSYICIALCRSINYFYTHIPNNQLTVLQGAVLVASSCSSIHTVRTGDIAPLVRESLTREGTI